MKKIDFKPILMEKGERIGLYAAAGLSFVFVVIGFLKVLGSGSATANAENLNKQIAELKGRQDRASPKPADLPGELKDVVATAKQNQLAAAEFAVHPMFFGPKSQDTMRQPPAILTANEFQVQYVRTNLHAIELDMDENGKPTHVFMVKLANAGGAMGAGGAAGAMGAGGAAGAMGGSMGLQKGFLGGQAQRGGLSAFGGSAPPAGAGGGNPAAAGALGAGGAAGMMGVAGGKARVPAGLYRRTPRAAPGQANKLEQVTLAEAENPKQGMVLAKKALPLRMAIIAGTFPYKKQVEEFRQKMHVPTHGAVLTERVKGEKDESWNSFQFRGLTVERATIEVGVADDKLVWESLPLNEAYKRIYVLNAKEIEKDDASLAPIKDVSRGLVMDLPKQAPGHTYANMISKLKNISDTLAKLNTDEAKKAVIRPSKIIDDGFNPYDPGSSGAGAGGGAGAAGAAGGAGVAGGAGAAGGMAGGNLYAIQGTGPEKDIKETSIEHCLLRFIDVTLEPGKTYRYRIKVRMANPNYSPKPLERKDTYPQFARDLELESDWAVVPQPVVVPPDSLIYACDQAAIDRTRGVRAPEANEAVVQIQRWVDEYRTDPKKNEVPRPVGEWVVAQRLIVRKGEYARERNYKTQGIPIKPLESLDQELDEKSPLEFGDDSVLVDFEGGNLSSQKLTHERIITPGEMPKKEIVSDFAPQELLMMTPEGRLITRVTATDETKPERIQRLKDYLDRVKAIKSKAGGGGPLGGGNPLGG